VVASRAKNVEKMEDSHKDGGRESTEKDEHDDVGGSGGRPQAVA
jgi:hypothetical protein